MVTQHAEDKEDQRPGTRAPNSKVGAAPQGKNSQAHTAKYGNDAIKEKAEQKDGAGAPEGYEPDTSVSYHAGKDGKPDQIHGPDGKADVSPDNKAAPNPMAQLPEGHTYRDRVEAQAKNLGIEIDPSWTLEYLLWVIRMRASS